MSRPNRRSGGPEALRSVVCNMPESVLVRCAAEARKRGTGIGSDVQNLVAHLILAYDQGMLTLVSANPDSAPVSYLDLQRALGSAA